MKRFSVPLVFALVFSLISAWQASGQAMRCGTRLIAEGDPRDKVLNECGPPTSVEEREEERYDWFDRPPPRHQYKEFERYGNSYRARVFVRVEIWTYNYGPSRFLDFVRLENGIVRKVYSGGYGY